MGDRITVYCDQHANKATVSAWEHTAFTHNVVGVPSGRGWQEWIGRAEGSRSAAEVLVDDHPADIRGLVLADRSGQPVPAHRKRYLLECKRPQCQRRRPRLTVPVKENRLFEILDRLSDHGVTEISLKQLAAVLCEQRARR